MYRIVFVAIALLSFTGSVHAEKMYVKEYYTNGLLRAEGWQMNEIKIDYWITYHSNGKVASKGHFRNNQKNGYWYFYTNNGSLEKEGHFIDGSAENWWIFYEIGTRNKIKFEYKNNAKNGFCLHYKKRKLVLVEKYVDNRKTGAWTSVSSFRRDNPSVSF